MSCCPPAGGPSIVTVCAMLASPSFGCSFATLSACQRWENWLVQPQEQVTNQRGLGSGPTIQLAGVRRALGGVNDRTTDTPRCDFRPLRANVDRLTRMTALPHFYEHGPLDTSSRVLSPFPLTVARFTQ